MFESFNSPNFYTIPSQILSLYVSGRSTGTVVDSGLEITRVVPIFDGYAIPTGVAISNIGGNDITN